MSRTINGKNCRWYAKGSLWVSPDGKTCAMPRKGGSNPKILKIKKGRDGKMYADHGWFGLIRLDRAVITCYCPPCPDDGNKYMIHHKDDNQENCNASNLEWIPYHYKHTTTNSTKILLNDKPYEVFRDGTIKCGGKIVRTDCSFYDSDMDLMAVISPFIEVPHPGRSWGDRVHIDDAMNMAGYIQGDNADMKVPVILHIDKDWENFASDNLEWCEADDTRYVAYKNKRKEDMHKRCIELNPGRNVPDWY